MGGIPETENEEMVIDDKQVDTIAARKRPSSKFLLKLQFIRILICFVFLSIPIVRLYRVLLISCFNGFFRN
ncbi:hypothetical protein V7457_10655, partial [Bacillus toyonensis]|uniref:hypothetical protein n=1 Tax=Bacillus toyonensis TaxID=155322 RepID=UPI002FFED5A3